MIPKKAFFYWGKGTPLSYLRYLTLVSFRKFHPDWEAFLYQGVSKNYKVWSTRDRQDFMINKGPDYISKISDIDIVPKEYSKHADKAPNFVSDFFRWDILSQNGGWYFDLDQIFCKSFDDLCEWDFIFGCKAMPYVGVLGISKESKLSKIALSVVSDKYDSRDYISAGPRVIGHLWRDNRRFKEEASKEKTWCTPNEIFYPISSSDMVDLLYSGKFLPSKNTYSIHWYGGHPKSQRFNALYTPAFAGQSKDTISVLARSKSYSL